MEKNNLEKLDLTLYHEELSNGLNVYIVPKDNVNGIYATFTTKFGSVNQEFIPISEKKMVKVPLGVAHFLEHKMFEQKDSKDPFTFYSERGCDSNANTSNYKTTYLFSGSNSFLENLDYLLDYVQSPYFTDSNVEKEKGIIEQEIKMYDDDPYFKMYSSVLYNAFHIHPIRYPIGGTKEDIYKITKEDLYTCYNTFYNPSNMFLVITGNVDPEDAIALIKLNQEKKKFEKIKKIKIKEYDEPDTVFKEYDSTKMNIELPKISVAYKFNFSKSKKNMALIKAIIANVLDLRLGTTSILHENLKRDGLITYGIDVSLVNTDKHILAIITFETEEIDKVIKLIEDELRNLSITEEELKRRKKIAKSNSIYRSDNIYSINNKIVSNIMNYNSVICDVYKMIDDVDMTLVNDVINKIKLDNKTVYVINKA